MNRTKILIVVGCVLGLALAWIPAYASPTSKKITVTCTSTKGDVVIGSAAVTLCSSIDPTLPDAQQCIRPTICPTTVTCESTGTISSTMVCSAPYKVGGVSITIGCQDGSDSSCGTSYSNQPVSGGKAVDFPADNTANIDGDGVLVTFK